jgi:hypothetical protein
MIAAASGHRVHRMNARCARTVAVLVVCSGLLILAAGCQESTAPAASRSTPEPNYSSAKSISPADPPRSTSTATASTSTTAQPLSSTSASQPSVDKPASPRSAVAARNQAIRNITFDTVKLDMKKGDPFKRSLITPTIERLDGARIRVRGYILPPFQQTGLTRFVLVRDNMACCFGPGAMIFDSMIVELKPGLTIDYVISPVAVEGTFNIRVVEGPSGKPISIYHVLGEKVQ